MSSTRTAVINSPGSLLQQLRHLPLMRYSEFGSVTPGVPSEDVLDLSYPSESFDLVITSDTLEHVPHPEAAFSEIYRVLKPGGVHIFTVPVLMNRPHTITRAEIVDGEVIHLLPPSYHGFPSTDATDWLVFTEFGADTPDLLRAVGHELEVFEDETNPTLITFSARRPAATDQISEDATARDVN